ncbi:MAG: hypothetical protein ABWY06_03080 [Pseudomonas sp.]|uniref:hypothetical protein n=1 Tax=Pseudomonas sp. TaxID=306 RepID=UPI0033912B25
MKTPLLIGLAVTLLVVLGFAFWNWRNDKQLKLLDRRVQRQAELLEALDQVLEEPDLSEAEQQARTEALLAQLKDMRKP